MVRACVYILISLIAAPIQAKIILGSELFDSPSFSSVDISPSGEWISAQTLIGGKTSLLLIPKNGVDDAYPIFTLAERFRIKSYQWINNSYIYLTLDKALHKNAFLKLDFSGKEPKATYKAILSKGYLLDGVPSQKNKVLYVATGKRGISKIYNISISDLIEGNLTSKNEFKNRLKSAKYYYSAGENGLFALAWSNKEKVVFVWYLNAMTGVWSEILQFSDTQYSFEPVGFTGSSTLAILSNNGQDRVSLMEFDMVAKEFGRVIYQHPKYDLFDAIYDEKEKSIQGVRYFDHGRLSTHYLTEKDITISKKFLRTFKDKQVYIVAESENSETKVLSVFASNTPIDYFVYDQKNNTARPISSSRAELDGYGFQKTVLLVVKNEQGDAIESFLTLPTKNMSNGVLLVMPHGGPIGVSETDFFNEEVQYLSSRGYAVLRVNFRGSSGYGKKFQKSGVGQFGKAIERDITAAVEKVRSEYEFSKMCSMGSSYGGYSAVMLAITHPQDYDCVVSMYGVYDLPFLFNASNLKIEQEYRNAIENIVGKMDDSLRLVSPIYLAKSLNVPILLVAGRKDDIADFEQSSRMRYVLKKENKEVESLFYNNTGHGHDNWYWERHQFAYIDDYLRRKLKIPTLNGLQKEEAIIEERVLIADSFMNANAIEERPEVAFQHYLSAAELGHARSMFNVGSYYHRGEVVDKDLETALVWYRKASNAGYAKASFRVAELYRNDTIIERNYKQSYEFYNQAHQQGYDAEASVGVGRAYCLGSGVEKDIEKCLNYLDFSRLDDKKNKMTNRSHKSLKETVVEIYAKGKFEENELLEIRGLVEKKYNLKGFEFEFFLKNYGVYNKDSKGEMVHQSTSENIELTNDMTAVGVSFNLKALDRKNKKATTATFAFWARIKNGVETVVTAHLLSGEASDVWSSWYWINSEEGDCDFKLEVFDIEQNKLFSKIFRT